MVDHQTVCCMCGDVGFPDKLFRCSKCHNRFQHSYCSSYYTECADPIEICDWCQCEAKNLSPSGTKHANGLRLACDKTTTKHREEGGSSVAEKANGKSPSPRTTTRRYKLLKDVMC